MRDLSFLFNKVQKLRRRKNEITPFSWQGGKTYHLDWLLPIINIATHNCFVEVFAGSGSVLLNKEPSRVEVYNDINEEVVNFFKVLRQKPDEIVKLLQLTPYSRKEFIEACGDTSTKDDLERARLFFVKARQVRNGMATLATPGKWSYTKKDSRGKRALTVNQWLNSIDQLFEISERLKQVQIECVDALEVIERYDTEDTLFYLDPPYLFDTRSAKNYYKDEYSNDDHIKMLDSVKKIKGKVIISGYNNDLYNNALKNWQQSLREPKLSNSTLTNSTEKNFRQEVVWTNFTFVPNGSGWQRTLVLN